MKKSKKKSIAFIAAVLVLIAAVLTAVSRKPVPSFSDISDLSHKTADMGNGWNLILVNREYCIPDDWETELTVLSNGEKVDSRVYPYLQRMFDDARADGLCLYVNAGYRTYEQQRDLLDSKTNEYRRDGYTKKTARELAEKWVALPGTSEHQLGLAVDINADTDYTPSDEVYGWLALNAYKYGFIQRYPEDKTEITGIIYEPWHYRYVGEEAAREIKENGMCLEEYIESL